MRVGIISSADFPPMEGIGHYIVNLGRHLRARGDEVIIFTRARDLRTHYLEYAGLRIIKVPFLPLYPFHVHFHRIFLLQTVKSFAADLDVLDFHSPLVPALDLNLPSVATVHLLMIPAARLAERSGIRPLLIRLQSYAVSRQIEQGLFRQSPIVSSVRPIEELELEAYRVKPGKIISVGVGVHEKFLEPVDLSGQSDLPVVFYAGRLDFTKGLFTLIDSVKHVLREYPAVRFVLAGDGPIRQALEERAKSQGTLGHIQFLGPVGDRDRMRHLHMSASVYVQPSTFEGLPASILEAMACGTPVVYSDIPGARHLISPQEGFLTPPGDAQKLAEAILTLLSDETRRAQMGMACREKVLANYTWEVVSQRIRAVYEEAIGLWKGSCG
jgi:glycosyltransferase involved in cell wall biosynthesis